MTKEEIQEIARVAAQEAVHETFLKLGIATNTEESVLEVQQDFSWLRRVRKGGSKIQMAVATSGLAVIVSGLLYALWEGLTHFGK